jgi:beta-carotene ketolase (CrtW type)
MDPDFPAEGCSGLLPWYGQFMAGYLTAAQMSGLLGAWAALAVLFSRVTPTAVLNVLVFCTLPLLLSSWQLFVFGTYLPHRVQRAPGRCPHPDSLDLPSWLSLLACFHFGYHREHHDNPGLAWFELPAAKERACTPTET